MAKQTEQPVVPDVRGLPPYKLAALAQADWSQRGKGVSYAALPYLQALESVDSWEGKYILEEARTIGLYFLSNAGGWRGPVARAVKAEIKRACAERPERPRA